jgi:hypothetical protein
MEQRHDVCCRSLVRTFNSRNSIRVRRPTCASVLHPTERYTSTPASAGVSLPPPDGAHPLTGGRLRRSTGGLLCSPLCKAKSVKSTPIAPIRYCLPVRGTVWTWEGLPAICLPICVTKYDVGYKAVPESSLICQITSSRISRAVALPRSTQRRGLEPQTEAGLRGFWP